MRQQKPLVVMVDCDDVLMPCIELAMQIQNKKYKFDPPMVLDEITKWSPAGVRSDCILECFQKPAFFRKQRPYPGAQEFIRKLCERTEVYVCTAVPICAMSIRAEMIKKFFPEIPEDHIIIGKDKSVIKADVHLDDGPHNILDSTAEYPVVMRRPWNQDLSGILSVNTYDEFLILIEAIISRFDTMELNPGEPSIVGLVGMSGSGKTTIAKKLVESYDFVQPKTYTDRQPRDKEENYNFVSSEEFKQLKNSGNILESTVYAGHNYGSSAESIKSAIEAGKSVVLPVDICGALALKTHFKNVVTIFVDRDKKDVITSVLERNCSNEDKANRIMSIDAEIKNANICDYVLENNGEIDDVMEELVKILNL